MAILRRKKTCRKCGRYLWLRDFYKMKTPSKIYKDGYDIKCKECRRREKNESYRLNRKTPDGIKRNSDGILIVKDGYSQKLYWGEMKTEDFKRRYPNERNEDLAIDFECSVRTVARRAREMGLAKNPEWLTSVWNKNRRMAHRVNKAFGNKADLTNFIEGGKPYRFKAKE